MIKKHIKLLININFLYRVVFGFIVGISVVFFSFMGFYEIVSKITGLFLGAFRFSMIAIVVTVITSHTSFTDSRFEQLIILESIAALSYFFGLMIPLLLFRLSKSVDFFLQGLLLEVGVLVCICVLYLYNNLYLVNKYE